LDVRIFPGEPIFRIFFYLKYTHKPAVPGRLFGLFVSYKSSERLR
jgi:hypothetical protein